MSVARGLHHDRHLWLLTDDRDKRSNKRDRDPHHQAFVALRTRVTSSRAALFPLFRHAVNPVVDFQLAPDGTLTFENAAVKTHAATPGRGSTLSWSRFDNAADAHEPIGSEQSVSEPRVRAALDLLKGSEYVAVTVRGHHPEHPAWAQPVRAYFRPEGVGWKTVGPERLR